MNLTRPLCTGESVVFAKASPADLSTPLKTIPRLYRPWPCCFWSFEVLAMAESIEEFFTDSKLTGTNLREAAASIHALLTGDAAASATAECLTEGFNAPGPVTASLSEVLEECIAGAAEQLSETHEGLVQLTLELRARQEEKSGGNLSDFDNGLVMTFGERWARYGDPDPSIIWRDQARLEWTNVNHFVALLYSAGVKRLSSFGELTLQRSLRRGGWRINWNGSGGKSGFFGY